MTTAGNMRAILTRIPVGDDPLKCGDCPFLGPDYGLGAPRGWCCAHPLLSEHVEPIVNGLRTVQCLAAEAEAERETR